MAHSLRIFLLRVLSLGLGMLPPGCGQSFVARFLTRRQWGKTLIVRQRLVGGGILELDLGDPPQAIAFVTRRYEPDIVALVCRLLPESGTFFDVGANIGLITFLVASRRRDVLIHAFEPDSVNAERWRRNRKLNPTTRVVLEPSALGASVRTISVLRGRESAWTYVAPAGSEGTQEAAMTTLDTYVERHNLSAVDVLKLDVEGYELFALQGGKRLLSDARIGAIVCEMNDPLLARNDIKRDDIVSFLADYGYSPELIPRTGTRRFRSPETLETSGDLLFVSGRSNLR
jgi:FkbM family methyltransferase